MPVHILSAPAYEFYLIYSTFFTQKKSELFLRLLFLHGDDIPRKVFIGDAEQAWGHEAWDDAEAADDAHEHDAGDDAHEHDAAGQAHEHDAAEQGDRCAADGCNGDDGGQGESHAEDRGDTTEEAQEACVHKDRQPSH